MERKRIPGLVNTVLSADKPQLAPSEKNLAFSFTPFEAR
jgi:hypothetical protein